MPRTPPVHRRRVASLVPLLSVEVASRLRVSADFVEYYAALIGQRFRKRAPTRKVEELRLCVQARKLYLRRGAAVLSCTGEIRDAVSGWVQIPGMCLLGGTTREQLLSVGVMSIDVRETVAVQGMANPWLGAIVKVLDSRTARRPCTPARARKLGRFFGYPACCIEAFVQQLGQVENGAEASFTAQQHAVHEGLGFQPCAVCSAALVQSGQRSATLIVDRECPAAFPAKRVDVQLPD